MVTKLRDGVWWIDLRGVNAYLVDDGGALTLFDAGTPWSGDALVDGIVDAGYAPGDLDRVLLTHYDADHVGGLARLADRDVTVYAGRVDAPLVAGERSPSLRSRKGALQALLGRFVETPEVEVVPLTDGDAVGSFTVYRTPGHTRGHVAYVSEALSTGVLGDLVRESGGELHPSPWLLSDDVEAVHGSVRRLVERAPSFEVAAVGHGIPFQRGGQRRLDELVGAADSLEDRGTNTRPTTSTGAQAETGTTPESGSESAPGTAGSVTEK